MTEGRVYRGNRERLLKFLMLPELVGKIEVVFIHKGVKLHFFSHQIDLDIIPFDDRGDMRLLIASDGCCLSIVYCTDCFLFKVANGILYIESV